MREKNTVIEKLEEVSNSLKDKSFKFKILIKWYKLLMTKNSINVVVAGATGYVGLDLVYLLSKHPNIKILNLCAQKKIKKINFLIKELKKNFLKYQKLILLNGNKSRFTFIFAKW